MHPVHSENFQAFEHLKRVWDAIKIFQTVTWQACLLSAHQQDRNCKIPRRVWGDADWDNIKSNFYPFSNQLQPKKLSKTGPKPDPILVRPRFQVWKRSWADNEVGGWFGPGASWTLTSFSWLSFIFNIECDNAVAANHDVVGSGEKSAPHKSCPAVTPPAEGASDGNNVSTSSDWASGFLWSQQAVQYKTANLSERGCFDQGSINFGNC